MREKGEPRGGYGAKKEPDRKAEVPPGIRIILSRNVVRRERRRGRKERLGAEAMQAWPHPRTRTRAACTRPWVSLSSKLPGDSVPVLLVNDENCGVPGRDKEGIDRGRVIGSAV